MRAVCDGLPLRVDDVDAQGWMRTAREMHARGDLLLTLWGAEEGGGALAVHACWIGEPGLTLARLVLPSGARHYPGLHDMFPVADRLQRGMRDLLGIEAQGMDVRPWLRHDAWGADQYPLRDGSASPQPASDYAFVPVDGEGVHEIAVGPIHAGIIEPGQFRFSVVGEKILRLEQRLGWVHRGVERAFAGIAPGDGVRLASRLSGDSAVANAWAYCAALEALAGTRVPVRGARVRALLLERERIANHLGDLGALGNDAGFGFALAQFSRLKEDVLRLNATVFGARYPMDAVRPGGVVVDVDAAGSRALVGQCATLRDEVGRLQSILDEHEGVQDRFKTTGRVRPELAARLGLLGLVGRASGQALDLRARSTLAPYPALQVRVALEDGGDVAARAAVRFAELFESLRLCREILVSLHAGPVLEPLPESLPAGLGIGVIEGWRGPAFAAVQVGADGRVARCRLHDPSWQNWPALEWAVIGDIVPDFPLINKSFNLSYAGQDG